ncbi:MAG: type VI secretion system ATPase TssH [Nannocystis sp.]|uniref:type VI secretion system ATPase TssH n=1 Tax=Nannocystis sp. TaxID=1962667 RepID=UPI0024250ACD|nr:type VI secretion system ATPase TssH [Nannocystis sp.]MBK9757070.1 type VI secretion system ATPase TssH [Nannocystis sp.]
MLLRTDPQALVRRLDPACTRALEAAVADAAAGRFHQVAPEHLLAALLTADEPRQLLTQLHQDPARSLAATQAIVQRLRQGNPGRPVLAEGLLLWLEDAWLLASVEHARGRVSPGELLLALLAHPGRYTGESLAALQIPVAPLRALVADLTAPTTTTTSEPDALARYTVSFTARARRGELDPVLGRDAELRQLIDILARRRKNSPIVVGEPGVGKTALVEGLALAIVAGEVPQTLARCELLGLDLGLLSAGASVRGELERRLKQLIAEIKASPAPIVLFIDEAHMLVGAGEHRELADLLKPELARGELRTIAATTWAEYRRYFEKDAALARRFQPVKVEAPDLAATIRMLRGLRDRYEHEHGVVIADAAIIAAAELSDRYLGGRKLPDKAIDLLDTAAARVKIEQESPPAPLIQLRDRLAHAHSEHSALQRDLDEGRDPGTLRLPALAAEIAELTTQHAALHNHWQAQQLAVTELVRAREALRAAPPPERPAATATLAQARAHARELAGDNPLVHAEVDRDAVARVLADWTGIPAGKLRRDATRPLLDLETTLHARLRGQDDAVQIVAEAVRMAHAGVRDPDAPIAVLLLVGPSGVGKTETALALAEHLYGGERQLLTLALSEFSEPHSVARLIGAPPGYVGHGEGGLLTEAVRQRPHSLLLLDECEKGDLAVMNLFYQVFDKGNLADADGRIVDFRSTLILLTSNLAADTISELHRHGHPTLTELRAAIEPTLARHFRPALLARMTVVPYRPVGSAILREIAALKLAALAARLRRAHAIETLFSPALLDTLVDRCLHSDAGARSLEHLLRGSLMPALARGVLEQLAADHHPTTLTVDLASDHSWSLQFSSTPARAA